MQFAYSWLKFDLSTNYINISCYCIILLAAVAAYLYLNAIIVGLRVYETPIKIIILESFFPSCAVSDLLK